MTSRLEEIVHGLATAASAIWFKRDAVQRFHDDTRAVWISFFALPIVATLFLFMISSTHEYMLALNGAGDETTVSPMAGPILILSTLIIWLAPLVVAYEFATKYDVVQRWPRFVVASSWCAVLQFLPFLLGMMVLQAINAPLDVLNLMLNGLLVWTVVVDWFIAKWAFGVTTRQAIALVAMLTALHMVLMTVAKGLMG